MISLCGVRWVSWLWLVSWFTLKLMTLPCSMLTPTTVSKSTKLTFGPRITAHTANISVFRPTVSPFNGPALQGRTHTAPCFVSDRRSMGQHLMSWQIASASRHPCRLSYYSTPGTVVSSKRVYDFQSYTRLQKRCYFRNIYHIYVWMPKPGGHTLKQPCGVAITCNCFFFDMHICLFWCWQKRCRRRKGIIIYMICMFWNSNVFENGCIYMYIYANVSFSFIDKASDLETSFLQFMILSKYKMVVDQQTVVFFL